MKEYQKCGGEDKGVGEITVVVKWLAVGWRCRASLDWTAPSTPLRAGLGGCPYMSILMLRGFGLGCLVRQAGVGRRPLRRLFLERYKFEDHRSRRLCADVTERA